jgi:hypothetical protein
MLALGVMKYTVSVASTAGQGDGSQYHKDGSAASSLFNADTI